MVRLQNVVCGTALLCLAFTAGWWLRGADRVAMAAGGPPAASSDPLEFQLSNGGPQASLTVYNPSNHTLYVYPRVGEGNSHIGCEYSLRVDRPGAPIDRENCPVADQMR